MSEEYETVYTIGGYWDGPRSGVADFKGVPHVYDSLFDDIEDEWTDTFLLSPIDEETFQLALEDWEIWLRWLRAWKQGEAPTGNYGVLPEDMVRHGQLEPILEERMRIHLEHAIKVRAEFKKPIPHIPLKEAALVKWTEISESNTEGA